MTRAVIDVGSNSVQLLVARIGQSGLEPVHETSRVTGLGTGTKATGTLAEPGCSQTLEALANAFDEARRHGADSVVAYGTMALRIATNAQDFVTRAQDQSTPVEILAAADEARLGFLGVANDPLFRNEERLTVIDPGGHSTELETASRLEGGWLLLNRTSIPVGALGLRDGILSTECPGPKELLAASAEIDRLIGQEYLPGSTGKAVVLGATGTNLVAIRDEIGEWDPSKIHGSTLDFEEVSRAVGWISKMTETERSRLVGLEPGRERTIHAGGLILERFMQTVHALEVTVSVRGWRHGLLEELG